MKLIGSATSPYVRKVRIVMAEKKLDYQFILEDVWAANTTITASNPLGKVPCLVMEGGEAVFDSRVIVEYLDTLSPVGKLIPAQGRERAEVAGPALSRHPPARERSQSGQAARKTGAAPQLHRNPVQLISSIKRGCSPSSMDAGSY